MQKRVQIGYRIDTELLARVDKIRAGFPVDADRSACIDKALEEWCDKWEKAMRTVKKERK